MNFIRLQKHILFTVSFILLIIFSTMTVFGNEKENEISFGQNNEYGSIYGAEYDPENGNDSKWLTIDPGDNGIRIIDDNNQDIFMVDKYGGVYVNGTLYVNNQPYTSNIPGRFTPVNGFFYFLIIISLCLNVYLLLKTQK